MKRDLEEELAWREDFRELEEELAWREDMFERDHLGEVEDELALREDMLERERFRGRNQQGERDETSQAMFESLYLHNMNQRAGTCLSCVPRSWLCPHPNV